MHSPDPRALRNMARSPQAGTWFRIENRASDTGVYLYDEIGGYGTTAASFVAELNAIDGPVTLYVGSRGGDVFDGMAIHSAIAERKAPTTAYVDSLAASIASVIVQAADNRVMSPNALMMIHEAYSATSGNSLELRGMADLLDKTSNTIAGVYASRSGADRDGFRAMMKAETWFTAEEALAAGLVDSVGTPGTPNTVENRTELLTAYQADQETHEVADSVKYNEYDAAATACDALRAAFN